MVCRFLMRLFFAYIFAQCYLIFTYPIIIFVYFRDIAGHERFGHMTRVYYKYA